MENASKALIIAGAILISILLISVGIIIMNSAGNITDQAGAQTDSMAIQTFNAQFTRYEGSGKTASEVRRLISAIEASNAKNAKIVAYYTVNKDKLTVVEKGLSIPGASKPLWAEITELDGNIFKVTAYDVGPGAQNASALTPRGKFSKVDATGNSWKKDKDGYIDTIIIEKE